MKRFGQFVLLGVAALALSSCMAGSTEARQMVSGGWLGQFLVGFWHGIVAPFTFVMSGLSMYYPDQLHTLPAILWGPWSVYDTQIAGFVYNIGFCFGLFLLPSLIWARPKILP